MLIAQISRWQATSLTSGLAQCRPLNPNTAPSALAGQARTEKAPSAASPGDSAGVESSDKVGTERQTGAEAVRRAQCAKKEAAGDVQQPALGRSRMQYRPHARLSSFVQYMLRGSGRNLLHHQTRKWKGRVSQSRKDR